MNRGNKKIDRFLRPGCVVQKDFPRQEVRRMVWLPLGGAGAEGVRGGRNGKWRKDRFFESIGPLTPLGSSPAGEPPAYGYRHLARGPFGSQPHLCLAAIDEPTRPLRGHPSSTRKGGALQHAYRFPHFRHGCVCRKIFPGRRSAGWSGSPWGEEWENSERIDSSNRYALSPLWGALPGESLPLTDIVI